MLKCIINANDAFFTVNGGHMRIPSELQELAIENGLECISTGGGFDYVSKLVGGEDGAIFLIGQPFDDGSPVDVDQSPANLVCWRDNQFWSSGVELPLRNARKAIAILTDPDLRAALVWESLKGADEDRVEAMANVVTFSASIEADILSGLISRDDASAQVLGDHMKQLHYHEPPAPAMSPRG